MTETEFNTGTLNAIRLSMAVSKIAADKATGKNVKEFADFELAETIAAITILKDLETANTEMDEEGKAIFDHVESCETGIEFDKSYIEMQLKNHKYLQDLTEAYLTEVPADKLDGQEAQEKNLAILAMAFYNEHITIIERIHQELNAEIAGS